MAVSYEFGALAYQQTKEYESSDWTEYVDYTDLDADCEFNGDKFITIFANGNDYLVKLTGRDSFEVFQLDETGEILIEISNTYDLFEHIADSLDNYWYDTNKDSGDDYDGD